MSNEEFENYIALVSRLLQLRGKQRDQISVELRDHLQTRAAELESEGENKQAALRQAIEEFGDAAAMARNFQSVQNLKRQRWMMRFTTFAIAGVFLAALFTMSMWPSGARFGSPETSIAMTVGDETTPKVVQPKGKPLISDSARRDAATEEVLKKDVSIEYEEVQFSDVMAELGDGFRLNFILHQSAIDDALTHEELVTVSLRGIPLAKALEFLLEPFNATYMIDEGVVVIISRDNMNDPENLRLKMFDCKKLVAAMSGSEGGETGEYALLKLVQSMVNPGDWQVKGAMPTGEGTASVVGGVLVVNQNESGIRKVSEMLVDLHGKVLGETRAVIEPKAKGRKPKAGESKVDRKPAPASKVADDPFG